MRTAVVIPAYNEEQKIGEVVKNLADCEFFVIVVDDGSTDDTEIKAQSAGALVLRHEVNLGQGAALRTGTQFAFENGFELIAHFDADGQHNVADLQKLVGSFGDNEHEIALGSRFLQTKNNIPRYKKIILYCAKIFSLFILKLDFTDPQNGLRVFRKSSFEKIIWQHDDYLHCTEILCQTKKSNIAYLELPITINYDEYSTTKKIKPKISMGFKLFWEKFLNRL
ncbi:MAG: glycosyltransferase family 2 protein [Patescibacteria group bacterium]